jgi:hypothetical protein
MSKGAEIKRVLKNIANDNGKSDNRNLFFTAEVKKVHDETCDVEVGGFTVTGVHLAAVSDGNANNLIIKPEEGSVVLVCDKTGGDMAWMNVVSFSEIVSIAMKVDKIVINDGQNDGLVKINKLTEKLNDLVKSFNTHTHEVSTEGGPTSQAGTAFPTSNQANTFNKTDYENNEIKH